MHQAYVGIATPNQLLAWLPETDHAGDFLLRRVRRHRGAICFWAVMPQCQAAEITSLMTLARGDEALKVLSDSLLDAGRILPRERERLPVIRRGA